MSQASATQGWATQRKVPTHDGRVLAVEMSGDRHGAPVFLLHGTPGSRSGPRPRSGVLYRLGVLLISYDRPGYGGSSRHPRRDVASAASDVQAIADDLELDRFAVVGRSGGGPHALACAALLPDRVTRAAVLVSLAPADAPGLDWFAGMTHDNIMEYRAADAGVAALTERLTTRVNAMARDPESLVTLVREQIPVADRRVVDDIAFRRLLAATYSEALRAGPYGWIDDVVALRGAWGFDLRSIKGPVLLWHGADDNFSPVSHTRWLNEHIPHAQMFVQPDTAHFGAMEVLPQLLPWLTSARHALVGAHLGAAG